MNGVLVRLFDVITGKSSAWKGKAGSGYVLIGTAGGSDAVTTMLNAVVATGAGAATGGGKATYQVVGSTTSGAGTATVLLQGSNNNVNWELMATFNLTLGVTAVTDYLVSDAPWPYVRGNVTVLTGTGANITMTKGM